MGRVYYAEMGKGHPRDQCKHVQRLKKADSFVGHNEKSSLTEVL